MTSIVHNQDCYKALKEYPDNYFDLCIADPPYFEGPNKRGYYGKKYSKTGVKRIDYPKTKDWKVPTKANLKELIRVSKRQIIFGINYYDFNPGPGRLIWDKCNGKTSFSDAEIAYISQINSTRIFRYMWNGHMQGMSINNGHRQQPNKQLNEKRIHPTQKPVNLYKWILNSCAKSGELILDPYTGSGSSRIAAYELEYNFVGFEINKKHFQNQEDRFKIFTSQLSLFNTHSYE